jgi:hypothetical protein
MSAVFESSAMRILFLERLSVQQLEAPAGLEVPDGSRTRRELAIEIVRLVELEPAGQLQPVEHVHVRLCVQAEELLGGAHVLLRAEVVFLEEPVLVFVGGAEEKLCALPHGAAQRRLPEEVVAGDLGVAIASVSARYPRLSAVTIAPHFLPSGSGRVSV